MKSVETFNFFGYEFELTFEGSLISFRPVQTETPQVVVVLLQRTIQQVIRAQVSHPVTKGESQ